MKIKEVEAITSISFNLKDSIGTFFDTSVKVVPGMATTNKGHHNFLTRVVLTLPKGYQPSKDFKLTRNLLFLESYGDDMPDSITDRIFGKGIRPIGVIDMDTQEFHWGCWDGKSKKDLILFKMGVLRKENDPGDPKEILPKDLHDCLNWKRPYHFEIDWWHVQSFLEKEEGWRHLRGGLVAVVRCGNTRYKTGYNDEKGFPTI